MYWPTSSLTRITNSVVISFCCCCDDDDDDDDDNDDDADVVAVVVVFCWCFLLLLRINKGIAVWCICNVLIPKYNDPFG